MDFILIVLIERGESLFFVYQEGLICNGLYYYEVVA